MKLIVALTLTLLASALYGQVNYQAKLDSISNSWCNGRGPGFSVGVVLNGKQLYTRGCGASNMAHNLKNTEETAFDIASIAKQFTAASIGILINQGRLSLEDDIRKYVPELPSYKDTIRIKHLLNHTSGIRNYHTLMQLSGFNYNKEYYNNQDILALLSKQKELNNVPGEKFLYSNSNYTLLTIILERITQQSLNSFAKENIFDLIRLFNTKYHEMQGIVVPESATGYRKVGEGYIGCPKISESYGAGSLWSSVEDLSKWSTIFYSNNEELKAISDFLTQQEPLNDGSNNYYGRGIFIKDYKGFKSIHHSGNGYGFKSFMITIPEKSLSVIVLSNTNEFNATGLAYTIVNQFLPKEEIKRKPAAKYKKKELKPLTGWYQEINSDLKIEVTLSNDSLFAKTSLSTYKILLIPTENKLAFNRKSNSSVTYDFNKTEETELVVDFGGGKFYFERIEPDANLPEDYVSYIGSYYSEELDVKYQITWSNDKFFITYPNNQFLISPSRKDEFGLNNRSRINFFRDDKGVAGFTIASEGTVKNIQFIKDR